MNESKNIQHTVHVCPYVSVPKTEGNKKQRKKIRKRSRYARLANLFFIIFFKYLFAFLFERKMMKKKRELVFIMLVFFLVVGLFLFKLPWHMNASCHFSMCILSWGTHEREKNAYTHGVA